jgi:putative integral membrane protein (TIGR02587 family)
MTHRPRKRPENPWLGELHDLLRALGGAYLFGTPLLYTMEMWWLGTASPLWRLLLYLILAFGLNLMLASFSGFRHQRTLGGNLEQAVDALAVGVVAATLMLLVLNRISWGDPLGSSLGKIIVQTVPLSLGASIANSLFARPAHEEDGGSQEQPPAPTASHALLNDLGATVAGGVFIGFSVAPTDEIPMLAAGLTLPHALALMVFSGLLSYVIVFTSLHGEEPAHGQNLPFQHPFTETVLAYALSLGVAFVTLLLYDRIAWGAPLLGALHQVLVLGLPVTVGGAAGRVIV